MLLSLLLLSRNGNKKCKIKLSLILIRKQFHYDINNIPIEFRLLLSPDKDCESTPVCEPFILGLTMLVGLDNRFSRSTSERKGLFGVS